MNMMRKNNNRNGGNKHRGGSGGGARRYNNNGGGNRGGANEGQNLQRQKHHATQQLGKYNDLARNAQINGDRVDVEYYLQHVDHYTRVLTEVAAIEAERFAHQRESQIIPGGPNDPNAAQHSHNANEQAETAPVETNVASNDSAPMEAQGAMPEQSQSAEQQAPRQSQPRPARQPRRQQPPREQADDNGAREANSNTTEIPLPGSILPPI